MSNTQTIQTEDDAMQEILAWSQNRPAWQRDALRRLLLKGSLDDVDVSELATLCKDSSLPGVPLTEDHVGAQQKDAPSVSLKSVRNARNVNALAEDQTLTFIGKGLTIIYGDNGSGKSGYVRVLKKACRARMLRGREEAILPNVYEDSTGPQCADIEYHIGDKVQKEVWKNGESPDPQLAQISVFDSRTANIHVQETNDLAYTPFPMKLLERLVAACKALKTSLDAEAAAIKGKTPESISNPTCSPETVVGKLIATLCKDTDTESVNRLAQLSDKELLRLAELTSDLAQDPQVVARRLRSQCTRVDALRSKLQGLDAAVSAASVAQRNALVQDLQTKSGAARLASQDFATGEPLEGVGTESWRALWDKARTYSMEVVYPGQEFPVLVDGARCVLCQQELEQEATDRLRRFEAFVQDRTQKEAEAAKHALDAFLETFKGAAPSMASIRQECVFLEDELGRPDLAKATRSFAILARWRHRRILRSGKDAAAAVPPLVDVGLDACITDLDRRIQALLADAGSEDRKKLSSELAELRDRQWLSGIKEDVLAEIERGKLLEELNVALKDVHHGSITTKNTALSEALVTERLRGRFAKEVDRLDLAGLAIELSQAGSQGGISRFKVSLIQNKSGNTGDVLSEGEFRCVALAGFMAELATNNSASGIIFDDPVSSLDHMHREAIAQRLAEEGRARQVVVFTHDLPFLFLLRNACVHVDDPALKTEVALRHIQKLQGIPGHCKNEAPEKAKHALERAKGMRTHLGNCRPRYEADPEGADWLITARGLVDSLRQAWEAAVEDAISPVLRTFSSKVNTKGFVKLSAITEDDAKTMRKHYGQCSVILHKTSDAMNPTAPTPDAIEKEIDALVGWLEAVSERQKKLDAA